MNWTHKTQIANDFTEYQTLKLLNLIFGHNCGDKVAADIASVHCAAVVSLAKSADLENPEPELNVEDLRQASARHSSTSADTEMGDDATSPDSWNQNNTNEAQELQTFGSQSGLTDT